MRRHSGRSTATIVLLCLLVLCAGLAASGVLPHVGMGDVLCLCAVVAIFTWRPARLASAVTPIAMRLVMPRSIAAPKIIRARPPDLFSFGALLI